MFLLFPNRRIGRIVFWRGILAFFAFSYLFLVFTFGFATSSLSWMLSEGRSHSLVNFLNPDSPHYKIIVGIIVLQGWATICLFTNRLRDTGASGWYSLLLLVPIIGFFGLLLFCGFVAGSAIEQNSKTVRNVWNSNSDAAEEDNTDDIEGMLARGRARLAASSAAPISSPMVTARRNAGAPVFGKRR